MGFNGQLTIIIPAYNAENTIEQCLASVLRESKKMKAEVIVIDDNSDDKTFEIVQKFNTIKLIRMKKNRGVGYARNLGARIAKHKILCYVDSDLVISENSIIFLLKRLNEDKSIGSVGAIQEVVNLNDKSWTSNFVCLKSCYGFQDINREVQFSVVHSEFCVLFKDTLKDVGGWHSFRGAGGEEFDLGYRMLQSGKDNILIKTASYSTYYSSLYVRFKKIIDRTEKYIPLFIEKRKFDTKGSFATKGQAFSSSLTLFLILVLMGHSYVNGWFALIIFLSLFLLQIIVEYRFLIFSKKYFGIKMLVFSIFGIQVINIGILVGVLYFFANKIKRLIRVR